ncbi:methylated-DNA--[protein]-cysteine S-methyltransferase [Haloarchaeobius sp. DFWS5]|uniref:methylated-DNA--[protein]-cysteine S-methyltransferase n=1 Tax=Haloarchaeobius sp. DFWS5 TaxID=3446114 RepID=UPI003EBAA6AE
MELSVHGGSFDIDESLLGAGATEVEAQVREYERGERESFDLDVDFPDDFTGRVMRAMCEIPRGETRTYGEVAESLDTSPVAVGQACGRNPVPVVVPCHRIVGTDWLGGFSNETEGERVDLKQRLLEHEGALPAGEAGDASDAGEQTTLADSF